ncbi:thioredoxin [Arthrobacter sp. FW306-2-2C-D06B]|uniref:thioredoxin n=1 Tax=Arthrobacter sp. FW306-2-2C-D06B TaxID=2879618 RepID=UPI001EFFFEBC|nr:thioredoxin [Arthrobacter sp. FW306-2-2C-D06B]UKA60705.1 thioredoxin [Arthrobacter sp. FW306-2-2C-D06B]
MSRTKEVTDASFDAEVLKSAKPVVVEFWAVWSGPCTRLTPVLEQLAVEYADKIDVVKVNVDENPETAGAFGISSVPSVFLFKDGERRISVIGVGAKRYFEMEFAEYLR